ncbi:LysR family transcriptional regulator [Falsochrobactrum shanghaiense]|uniref:LysR family transcriptional regulator n=1 Tax=Falsochrobactrum shanghaiense TaxID=2201899 RepID=UPI0011B1F52E|nr:LysR family transcriptional regulator [Falsochrobactrum shanghaiense]
MNENINNLSLKQLRAIQAVARYSSFLAAAVELRMSQPGISRLVRSVEESLGVRLFHRSTRHVLLTQEGLTFLPTIDRVLAEIDISVADLVSMRAEHTGRVIMACPLAIANRMLSGIIAPFRTHYPHVRLEIREALRSAVIQQVRHGTVDFALGSFMEASEDIQIEELCGISYRVVFPRSHRFAAMTEVSLSDMQDEPMVSLPSTSILRSLFDAAASRQGFRLRHMVTVNTIGSVFDLVENGQAIAIQSDLSISSHLSPRIESRPLVAPRLTSKLSMLLHKERMLSPAALELKQSVEFAFRERIFHMTSARTDD